MYELLRLTNMIDALDNDQNITFDECLLWDGTLNKYGQGRVRTGLGKWHIDPDRRQTGSKLMTVSRFAYEYVYGPLAAGMQVLHHCDRPNCINPFHLFAGTQQDNMLDAAAKRRLNLSKQGEKHPAAKLSDEDVEFIRNSTMSQIDLARMFSCDQSHVSRIKSGETRKNQTGEIG